MLNTKEQSAFTFLLCLTQLTNLICQFPALLLYHQFGLGQCLSLKNVTIPQYGINGDSALLSCEFSPLPSDKLLFLKWYKNDAEFYRFTPAALQPILTFPQDGISVELSRSNFNQLVLTNLTLETSGLFKCEAMAEGTFQAPFGVGSMNVIAPPETRPVIAVAQSAITAGDRVNGKCTSYRSKPAAELNFYVDGIALENAEITESEPIPESNGLETSVLAFSFQTEKHHFKKGILELKCTATILNLYWITTFNLSEIKVNAQPSHTEFSWLPSAGNGVGGMKMLILGGIMTIWQSKVVFNFFQII